MSREELNRKAEEYALEKCKECYMCNSEENGERGYCPKYESRIEGYIAGATKETKELEAQIEKMKKYIRACWVEENLNDYSSYITNSSDEFRDLVKELNEEIRNGR